jgi:hypothetical protein
VMTRAPRRLSTLVSACCFGMVCLLSRNFDRLASIAI